PDKFHKVFTLWRIDQNDEVVRQRHILRLDSQLVKPQVRTLEFAKRFRAEVLLLENDSICGYGSGGVSPHRLEFNATGVNGVASLWRICRDGSSEKPSVPSILDFQRDFIRKVFHRSRIAAELDHASFLEFDHVYEERVWVLLYIEPSIAIFQWHHPDAHVFRL